MPKKRNIPSDVLRDIALRYIENKKSNNLAALSKEINIPYSTLRRYLLNYLKDNALETVLLEEYLPYEGFEYMSVGDTYQWEGVSTVWHISTIKRMDGEKVFVSVQTHTKSSRHWLI